MKYLLLLTAVVFFAACNNDAGKTEKPATADSVVSPAQNPPGYGDETTKDTSSYERMSGKITDSMQK